MMSGTSATRFSPSLRSNGTATRIDEPYLLNLKRAKYIERDRC